MSNVVGSSFVSGIFGGPAMKSMLKGPKMPKMPSQEESSPIAVVETEAERSRRRQRKKLMVGGRRSTILSGIQTALKKRLGE